MKYLRLLSFIVLIAVACKRKAVNPTQVYTMNDTRPIEKLKELVLSKGDTTAFNELAIAFFNQDHKEEYLIYSVIMANKYHFPRAYYQVYNCLTSVCESSNIIIDKETMELAIKYVKKGAELKDGDALMRLSDLYNEGKYIAKDTILGNKLANEARKIRGF